MEKEKSQEKEIIITPIITDFVDYKKSMNVKNGLVKVLTPSGIQTFSSDAAQRLIKMQPKKFSYIN